MPNPLPNLIITVGESLRRYKGKEKCLFEINNILYYSRQLGHLPKLQYAMPFTANLTQCHS